MKACVKMSSTNGKWNDIDCNTRLPFICMKRGEQHCEQSPNYCRDTVCQTLTWTSKRLGY